MRGHVLENRVESYKGRHLMSASGLYMHKHTYTVQHINIQITHMEAKHGGVGLYSQWWGDEDGQISGTLWPPNLP